MHFACYDCGKKYGLDTREITCECGGLFRASLERETPPELIAAPAERSIWRYHLPARREIYLGEGWTPLLQQDFLGHQVYLKLDYLFPTGSFKDRGAAVLVNRLLEMGVGRVVEDSSGNAGAAIAAYCAAAGISCTIVVPEDTSAGKIKQIKAYGAEIALAEGGRPGASSLVRQLAGEEGIYYASHIYNPFFYEGTGTLAFEVWEQLADNAPDYLVIPAGNGTMLLGAYYGFLQLQRLGLIREVPRLVAVQEAGCTPLLGAAREGCEGDKHQPEKQMPGGVNGATAELVSEGISIPNPPRLWEMATAVDSTGGWVEVVTGSSVQRWQRKLAFQGFYVEATAAAAAAALEQVIDKGLLKRGQKWVLPLTGSGLKK
ncbi:MAG: pyridoxal-phosphate dependent enzyme [Halanaerobium sp.]|nr:pyridoxal-phosphate dependent enzyme [Halanaerobium sp.]